MVDPIVSPGVPSSYAQAIFGGNAFSNTVTYEDTQKSTCTTAGVTADKSNYLASKLYIANTNGSVTSVAGGLVAYHMTQLNPGEKITAYPPGFRMVAGNPLKKSRVYPDNVKALPAWSTMDFSAQQTALAEQAITWTCFTTDGVQASTDTSNANSAQKFPTIPCQNFRAELSFPSCWNGKDMDSADHKSHVAYPDQM